MAIIAIGHTTQASCDRNHHHRHHGSLREGQPRRRLDIQRKRKRLKKPQIGVQTDLDAIFSHCKNGEPTFTIGEVVYECEEEFNLKGGQCKSKDRSPEEKVRARSDFKKWKEDKSKMQKRNKETSDGERELEGCGIGCLDWETTIIVVPTYFHVIHNGELGTKFTYNGYRDSNPDYIINQIKAMNRGFQGEISEYPENVAGRAYPRYEKEDSDTHIRFCLMNATATNNNNWYMDKNEKEMKQQLGVGGMESLNVYVNTAGGFLGYAQYPTSKDNDIDGVVINNESMPGGNIRNYNEGDTLTHEVGHWLGLEHTHDGGCNGPGDYMDDAPPSANYASEKANEGRATFTCPMALDNCDGDGGKLNPVHNFMSYTPDSCMDEFTPGQKVNLREAWEVYRHKVGYSEHISLATNGYSCEIDLVIAASDISGPSIEQIEIATIGTNDEESTSTSITSTTSSASMTSATTSTNAPTIVKNEHTVSTVEHPPTTTTTTAITTKATTTTPTKMKTETETKTKTKTKTKAAKRKRYRQPQND